jgi:cation diffusion facilitator CzcD-associated flavoprotein CzcO
MLQRSPSYFLAPPLTHELAVTLRALDIPEDWTHEILRRAYSAQFDELARLSHEAPDELHAFLMESMKPLLPEGFDVEKHFTPRYRPWQQRIAIVPEGDLFAALRERPRSSPTRSTPSRRRASASAAARSSRPTWSSPPPASTSRRSATSPSPWTANRSPSPSASPGAAS